MFKKLRAIAQEIKDTPLPEPKKERPKRSGECTTIGCPRNAKKDGYCMGCWSAIFG